VFGWDRHRAEIAPRPRAPVTEAACSGCHCNGFSHDQMHCVLIYRDNSSPSNATSPLNVPPYPDVPIDSPSVRQIRLERSPKSNLPPHRRRTPNLVPPLASKLTRQLAWEYSQERLQPRILDAYRNERRSSCAVAENRLRCEYS
jgi:hypothetical protein